MYWGVLYTTILFYGFIKPSHSFSFNFSPCSSSSFGTIFIDRFSIAVCQELKLCLKGKLSRLGVDILLILSMRQWEHDKIRPRFSVFILFLWIFIKAKPSKDPSGIWTSHTQDYLITVLLQQVSEDFFAPFTKLKGKNSKKFGKTRDFCLKKPSMNQLLFATSCCQKVIRNRAYLG